MPFKCDQPAVPTVQQDDATARITRWDFAPGAATGWHSHGWPYFIVMLTDAVMKIEAKDGAVSEVRLSAGQSYQRPSGVEHDVMNGADVPMAFVEIEIKQPDGAGLGLNRFQIGGYPPWNSAKNCVVIQFKPIRLTADCTLLP